MSQTIALVLPLPVALALVLALIVLVALSAVALSFRKPTPVRLPLEQCDGAGGRLEEGAAFRLGHLHIDGLGELSGPQRILR